MQTITRQSWMVRVIRTVLPSLILITLFQPAFFEGASMQPTLHAGDVGLLYRWGTPRVGDIVCAKMPWDKDTIVVKQVAAGPEEGLDGYYLLGDNTDVSLDSRAFGTVSQEDIIGTLVLHLPMGKALTAISSLLQSECSPPLAPTPMPVQYG